MSKSTGSAMTGRGGAHGNIHRCTHTHTRGGARIASPRGFGLAGGFEAGRFLLTERPDELSVESKSTPTDVVTSMDKAAEHLLFERLLGERPGDGLMGEEGSDCAETGIRWIVDPLDGTVNYLYRIPWGCLVAAEDQDLGATVVGVIVTPETGEGFIGIEEPARGGLSVTCVNGCTSETAPRLARPWWRPALLRT